MVAGGCGERKAPSQPPLKHAGLGIWSEPASLAGAVFPSAHTCAFCLSAVFPPSSLSISCCWKNTRTATPNWHLQASPSSSGPREIR